MITPCFGRDVSVTRLVKSAVRNIKSAPQDFTEADETVRSLEILFDSIATEVQRPESIFKRDPELDERFGVLLRLCLSPLTKLCQILKKYGSLGSDNVKFFDRLKFSKREVLEIQRELALRYANLSTFLETLGLGGIGRVESKVDTIREQQDRILEAIDKFANDAALRQETASVMTDYTNDDKAVWKQLRRDLNLAGIKSSDIEKHKMMISNKLFELRQSGVIELDTYDNSDNWSEVSITFVGHERNNYKPPTVETVYEGSDDENEDPDSAQKPPKMDTLFEQSDDEVEDTSRPRQAASERLPSYQDVAGSPRISDPAPINAWVAETEKSRWKSNAPPPPQITRQPSSNKLYDYDVLVGKRSISNPTWRYRRTGDIQRPPMQSADLQDGTLPMAASQGQTLYVQRVLNQGYNIEATGSRAVSEIPSFDGTTALYRAAKSGHFETAQLLLRNGANPNVWRKDGKSLLRLLAVDGSTEIVRLLLEYGANPQKQGVLPQAAFFGHLEVAQLLIAYGADIEEVEKQTALYRAASKGFADIVELLLREGANTGFITPTGQSALFKAVQNGNFHCTRLLLLYGARPHVGIGSNGETALYQACALGQEPTVRLLLRRGARPNDWCRTYKTSARTRDSVPSAFVSDGPLLVATRLGRLSIAKLLLDYGAHANAKNQDGVGAIDIAAARGHVEMVNLLAAFGGQLSQQAAPLPPPPPLGSMAEVWDRGPDRGLREREDPRAPRRFNSSTLELDFRERRSSDMPIPRPPNRPDIKRRSKSTSGTRRGDTQPKTKSNSSAKIGATAAVMLLADSLMMLS
ncbi:hypothetical protein LTR37_005589 [Vermiconidia calcicola]|uniref:Uncharacterized protein n=1 Tax=Vermiconidia calcicola TaxID=1690605 RepID=A0ACC3NJZ1_9PEZI|nr:hypothetical protein LTR37_005589 [Vermiconidia calcicola]